MKKFGALLAFLAALLLAGAMDAQAGKYKCWRDITNEMETVLQRSCEVYASTKDAEKAKAEVNSAYYDYYETLGVERNVKNYISGKRAAVVEYQFAEVKRRMTDGASDAEVKESVDVLCSMLREDADLLDGDQEEASSFTIFLGSFLILVREGIEAILVVAAISAYLARSGNQRMNRVVYFNAGIAVVASAILAFFLQGLFNLSGANQEILEGATMLLAVVVLFFVSNWMVSKAEAKAWKNYIEDKVSSAVTTGNAFALGFAAFLAVFREGAETILFYQALLAESREHMDMIWYGIGAASVCLVFIFMIIRYGSLRLPLRPFFIGTSILMYVMCVAFAGGGVKELQEADIVPVTQIPFPFTIDILGVYPTVETLVPQAILLIVAISCFVHYRRKGAASAQ